MPPDPPHTIHFVGPHFFGFALGPPNPLGSPAHSTLHVRHARGLDSEFTKLFQPNLQKTAIRIKI